MLAGALEGVVTQQLLLNADGTGRLAACEVMICTAAIRNLVRSAKTHQIYSLMQTGGQYGMQTMDQGLAKLVKTGTDHRGCRVRPVPQRRRPPQPPERRRSLTWH